MFPEIDGDLGFVRLALRDIKGDLFEPRLARRREMNPVQFQKNISCHRTNPFVSIDKRMIQCNMEKIGGCHEKQILMEKLAAKLSLGHRQG